MWDVLATPGGHWRRAGSVGAVIGLDLTDAMARLPQDICPAVARELLISGELGVLAGLSRKDEED